MKLSYEELISGDSIPVKGVGHIQSPKLWQLNPTRGIGMWTYNLYLNILAWEKNDFLNFVRSTTGRSLEQLDNDKLNIFDTMTLVEMSRELLQKSLSFFICEKLEWSPKESGFITKNEQGNNVGVVNRDNFDDLRDAVLQLNYIGLGKSAKPVRFNSKKTEKLWKMSQQYLKEESKKKTEDKTMSLGNIISKLCASSTSYNLLNIYDLTIFQLYDQFFQYGYLRVMNLNEMAFSNHGGKDFDIQAWLKPITKF